MKTQKKIISTLFLLLFIAGTSTWVSANTTSVVNADNVEEEIIEDWMTDLSDWSQHMAKKDIILSGDTELLKQTSYQEDMIQLEDWMYQLKDTKWTSTFEEETMLEDWMLNPSSWLTSF